MKRRDLDVEVAVLERLQEVRGGRILTAVYLVGAYWSWWVTVAVVALLLWRVAGLTGGWLVALGFGLLAAVAYAAKVAVEGRYGDA